VGFAVGTSVLLGGSGKATPSVALPAASTATSADARNVLPGGSGKATPSVAPHAFSMARPADTRNVSLGGSGNAARSVAPPAPAAARPAEAGNGLISSPRGAVANGPPTDLPKATANASRRPNLGPFWVSASATIASLQDPVISSFPSPEKRSLTTTTGNQTIVCMFLDADYSRLGRGVEILGAAPAANTPATPSFLSDPRQSVPSDPRALPSHSSTPAGCVSNWTAYRQRQHGTSSYGRRQVE
jgi:hypothetical protein